jgi:hypothetical protein
VTLSQSIEKSTKILLDARPSLVRIVLAVLAVLDVQNPENSNYSRQFPPNREFTGIYTNIHAISVTAFSIKVIQHHDSPRSLAVDATMQIFVRADRTYTVDVEVPSHPGGALTSSLSTRSPMSNALLMPRRDSLHPVSGSFTLVCNSPTQRP